MRIKRVITSANLYKRCTQRCINVVAQRVTKNANKDLSVLSVIAHL